jgi:hypothetical protein
MHKPASGAPFVFFLAYNETRSILTSEASMSTTPTPDLNPGDEAAPGTPGSGEDTCPNCHGTGKLANGSPCPECGGTGKITEGIGGG